LGAFAVDWSPVLGRFAVLVGWRASLRVPSARPTALLPAARCMASTEAGVVSPLSSAAVRAAARGQAGTALDEAGSVSVVRCGSEGTMIRHLMFG
jgi:hypothetical protein